LSKVAQWGQKEKGMPSVQKCEALAVKGAVEDMAPGEMAHIHTDSKVTVQALRTIMAGVYRNIRKLGNLQVMVDIVDLIHSKGVKVMLEWVKAHETYEGKDRNCANKEKEEGKQWADEGAKRQVLEGRVGGDGRG